MTSYITFNTAYYKHEYLITLSHLENHTPDEFAKTIDKAEKYTQQKHLFWVGHKSINLLIQINLIQNIIDIGI